MAPLLHCLNLTDTPIVVSQALLAVDVLLNRSIPGSDKLKQLSKQYFFENHGYEQLCTLISTFHRATAASDEVISAILRSCLSFLACALSPCHVDMAIHSQVFHMVLLKRIELLQLCRHPDDDIASQATLFFISLFYLCDLEQMTLLQDTARQTGALLWILRRALLDNKPSIELFEMICADNAKTRQVVLKIIPNQLLDQTCRRRHRTTGRKRNSNPLLERFTRKIETFDFDTYLKDLRINGENWRQLIHAALSNHDTPKLIWHDEMRTELQDAVTMEIERLDQEFEQLPVDDRPLAMRWDATCFRVDYLSLRKEFCINGYYIDPLLPKLCDLSDRYEVDNPLMLNWHLLDHFLTETDTRRRLLCLITMRMLLRRYAMIFNGDLPFRWIIQTLCRPDQPRLIYIHSLLLIQCAIKTGHEQRIVDDFIALDGLTRVLQLMCPSLRSETLIDEPLEMPEFMTKDATDLPHVALSLVVELIHRASYLSSRLSNYFQPIVQLLNLCPTSVDLILELLTFMEVSTHPPHLQTHLVTCLLSIAVEINMRSSIATYLIQFTDLLAPYLPEYMIGLLYTNPTEFQEVFNANLTETSQIYWTRAMRNHLGQELTTSPPQISYESFLEDEFYVGGIFVERFVSAEDNNFPSTRWSRLIQSLLEQLALWNTDRYPVETCKQVYLLQALKKALVLSNTRLSTPNVLVAPLHRTLLDETDQLRAIVSLEILHQFSDDLAPIARDIFRAFEKTIEPAFLSNSNRTLVLYFLDLVCRLLETQVDDIAIETVWIHCLEDRTLLPYLHRLLQQERLQAIFIEAGGVIELSRLCIQDESILAVASLNLIRQSAGAILDQLLTRGLATYLSQPAAFFEILKSRSVQKPTIVWNNEMLSRLIECLEKETRKIKRARDLKILPRWNPNDFLAAESYKYQFPSLQEEVIVDHVFVREYIESKGRESDINLVSFAQDLVDEMADETNPHIQLLRDAFHLLIQQHPEFDTIV